MNFRNKFLRHYIKKAVNIFDLYLYLFVYMKKYEADVITIFHEKMSTLINYKKMVRRVFTAKEKIELDINYKRELYELINQVSEVSLLVIAVFQEIDYYANLDYRFSHTYGDEETGERIEIMKPLNSQQTIHLGKVFYKQPSFLQNIFTADNFPRKSSLIGSSIEAFQNNLVIVMPDDRSDYRVSLLEIKCNYIRDKLQEKKGEIRVALVPFTSDAKYVNFSIKANMFFVKGLNGEEDYIGKLFTILKKLQEAQVDIVVFPEIVFSRKIMAALRQYLKINKNKFTLLIGGSIWENRSNKCELVNGNGLKLSEQYKLNRYHVTSHFARDGNNEGIRINSTERIINLFNIQSLGRIAVPICADFICSDYFRLLKKYGVNVCFISAFTATLDRFIRYAQMLGEDNAGTVFLANCCIPMRERAMREKSTPDLLFAYLPIKKKENLIKMSTCSPTCVCYSRKICYLIINFTAGTCVSTIIKV